MKDMYEKLGMFYLGKPYDIEKKEVIKGDLTLYESKDLKTHAVCLGMTGSGKTGLCMSLLEEAAIDNIPIIAIDPKGDISNLLLGFEEMTAENFKPWVNESEAKQKEISIDDLAQQQAQLWSKGIRSWDQTEERIKKIKEAVDMRIYTPGDDAGIQLSLFGSFKNPGAEVLKDSDALSELVENSVTSFLSIIDSKMSEAGTAEHTFISQIIIDAWSKEESVNLAALIGYVQNPPFNKVGVLDLETFFSKSKRSSLALKLNALFASPKFKTWSKGEALNVSNLLYKNGKPQVSIISISHLEEEERIFFVSRLLNDLVSWVRKQPGTSSLRAILYMDEIYGYFPPNANPATKKPMLTLLKQARAQGLGVVLATQNPVDLDYKGLSNTGTWFIGRLQTEQDKARLLDGLKSIGSSESVDWDKALSSLDKRVFLMHNVHSGQPQVFHTRWALSYLSGPMTNSQIKKLMDPYKKLNKEDVSKSSAPSVKEGREGLESNFNPKTLPKEIDQKVLDIKYSSDLKPFLGAVTSTHYSHSASGLNETVKELWYTKLVDSSVEKLMSFEDASFNDLSKFEYVKDANYEEVPSFSTSEKFFSKKEKEIENCVYRSEGLSLFKCADLKQYSKLSETLDDFKERLSFELREERDNEVDRLKKKFEKKVDMIEKRILRAEQKVEKEKEQYSSKKMSTMINFGTAIASVLMGGKALSSSSVSKAGSVMRGASSASKEKGDISRAEEQLKDYQTDLEEIHDEMEEQILSLEDKLSIDNLKIESFRVAPKKTNIETVWRGILWVPQ